MKTTTETDKATARPWKAVPNGGDDPNPAKVYIVAGVNRAQNTLADCSYCDTEESEANAALIVKAVNEHAALCAVAEATALLLAEVHHQCNARTATKAALAALAAVRK